MLADGARSAPRRSISKESVQCPTGYEFIEGLDRRNYQFLRWVRNGKKTEARIWHKKDKARFDVQPYGSSVDEFADRLPNRYQKDKERTVRRFKILKPTRTYPNLPEPTRTYPNLPLQNFEIYPNLPEPTRTYPNLPLRTWRSA